MPAFHADVLLACQHALRVEPPPVVRHRELDGVLVPRHPQALPRRSRVAVAIGEGLLEDSVDCDLRREPAVAQVGGQLELHDLIGQGFVLDREPFDDLAKRAPLEARGPEGADEVADLAEGALEQSDRLLDALLRRGVARDGALDHLQLRQRGEDVLHGPVVHVEHDALELPLARGEEAARRGAALSVPQAHRAAPRTPPWRSIRTTRGGPPAPPCRGCAPRPAARIHGRRGRPGTGPCPSATGA